MAKRVKRSAEWYARALKGDKENLGLRNTARGFSSRDGFNLRDGLTSAQKAKVTRAFHELQMLTAQPRYIYKPKSNSKAERAKLEKAQRTVQGDATVKWKVAFIPHVPRKTKSGKESKPKIYFGREGISVREVGYSKITVPLNQSALVKNPDKEIERAIRDNAAGAQRFSVLAGANEIPGLTDRVGITAMVRALMNKYDGKSALPKGSGNRGDSPKSHHWRKWLRGIVAYKFPSVRERDIKRAMNEFNDAREALQRKRKNARKRLNRRN